MRVPGGRKSNTAVAHISTQVPQLSGRSVKRAPAPARNRYLSSRIWEFVWWDDVLQRALRD